MTKWIPLTLLSLSLGAPVVGFAATPRAAAGVTKVSKKKKNAGAKRSKKKAPAALGSLPNP